MDDTLKMVAEHARGDSYRTLASRYEISHETARQIVLRNSRRHIDGFELGLLLAWKYEQQGRPEDAEWPTLLVPFQDQESWQLSLALLQFTVDELRNDRGLDVHVQVLPIIDDLDLDGRRKPTGQAVGQQFQLTIEDLPRSGS